MAQRYTTFIPGYVFNIFEPLYTRVGTYTYTFILLWPVVQQTCFAQKFFSEQSAQYRIEPKGPPCQYFMN